MKTRRTELIARSLRLSLATIACAWTLPLFAAPAFDTEINKTVWKMLFGLTDAQVNDPAWLAQDTDGDGLTNQAELIAGTNPLSPASVIAITNVSINPTSALLTIPTIKGKLYVIEFATILTAPANWAGFQPSVQVMGNGAAQTLTAPIIPNGFYRAVVQDVDTDGDGVSDWAEIITGFDPNNTHSRGSTLDDHTALVGQLANENIVTVAATDPATTQPPDAATAPSSSGSITVTRSGVLNFNTITVTFQKSGTAIEGTDYLPTVSSVTFLPNVSSVKVPIVPKANPARLSNATVTIQALPGGTYTVATPDSASVVIYPAGKATGTGLTGYYYNSTSTAINAGYNAAVLFATANLRLTRNDPTVDFIWNNVSPGPGVNATYYTVRWLGQVQPQYSETYYFVARTNDGVKLWVNGQLIVDHWVQQGATDWTGAIDLRAGVLYDIKMEYFQATGSGEAHLSWYSADQVKQVVPMLRLYPATGTTAPPSVTSALTAFGFVGQPFIFTVTASSSLNTATTFALGANSGALPPGLSLDANTGIISGTPTLAGHYQVALVSTNAFGNGSSVLDIQIINTGSAVTREIWRSGVNGTAVSDIPLTSTPNSIDNSLTTLEDNTSYADSTAERLRGYFTAPTSGNYYFWIAASNAAELSISNDSEPVNKVRRAWIATPGTGPEIWNDPGQPNQKSGWLALVAGKRYYYEVLHNHGIGTATDNVAVAWFLDPTGTTASPIANNTSVVPGFVLTQFDYPLASTGTGTLYATNMAPQGVSLTTAVGSANLRLSSNNTQAILHFQYGGLSSPRTGYHLHSEVFGANPSQIILDIDDIDQFHPELKTADGGYIWNIEATGTLTAADIVSVIQQGKAYINIHSVNYPSGEIRGNFGLVRGSQTAPIFQPDPGYDPSEARTDAGAARFLNQATYGASNADVAYVKAKGYEAWLDLQFALPSSLLVPDVLANATADPTAPYPSTLTFNAWWKKSITAPDQLRQRVAFALSELLVASDTGTLNQNGRALADYYDTLLDNAFLNFREILKQVTLTPAMGLYLDMRGNQKGDLTTGLHPNENYAREIMQLFSLGLNRLWPDGSIVLDSQGNLLPTYDQKVVDGVARVLTGWNYNQPLQGNGRLPINFNPAQNFLDPMVLVPLRHELGAKQLLDNVVLPAARGYSLTSPPVPGSEADPAQVAFDTYCLQDFEKALDSMFNNASVGPFVCRQLIQRLVSSNPSPGYLHRVVQKFNDDGTAQHVRGNMQAVIKAILLDGEARNSSPVTALTSTSGKQREPLLRLTGPARAFPAIATTGSYSQNGGTTIQVTTTTPHLLANGNGVFLDFTGNTPIPFDNPTSQSYSVAANPPPTALTFSVAATGLQSTSYTQPVNSTTITVNTGWPSAIGGKVYLNFTSGGAPSGIYPVASLPDGTHFTVTTSEDPATVSARTGVVLIPKQNAGYVVRNVGTPPTATITVSSSANHNLQVNDHVWLDFVAGAGSVNTDAEFTVASIVDEDHFTIVVPNSTLTNETLRTSNLYMLVPPPLTRSGNVRFEESKYDVAYTETELAQTPLNAPTVFNYFFPDYKFPGPLAANNLTTPEFQLTTDTNVITLTNSISSTILSSSNVNGLSSFRTGTITLDVSAYMTPGQTSNAGIPALVDKLGDLLTGGQLTAATKTAIINFAANPTNFPYTAPNPTATQMRDRVRAVVHLIVTSPEYAIQK